MLTSHCMLYCRHKLLHSVCNGHRSIACLSQTQTGVLGLVRSRYHLNENPAKHMLLPQCVNVKLTASTRRNRSDSTIGKLPKRSKGIYVMGSSRGPNYVYTADELDNVVKYHAFIKDMEKLLETLKRVYAKLPDKIEQQIKNRRNKKSELPATLENILMSVYVPTQDGRFNMVELVTYSQPHSQIVVLQLKWKFKVYLREVITLLEDSEMNLHPRVAYPQFDDTERYPVEKKPVDINDVIKIYVSLSRVMEIHDKTFAKVNTIGAKILQEMQWAKSKCLRKRQLDVMDDLFQEVHGRVMVDYRRYISNAEFIINSERQRWDWDNWE